MGLICGKFESPVNIIEFIAKSPNPRETDLFAEASMNKSIQRISPKQVDNISILYVALSCKLASNISLRNVARAINTQRKITTYSLFLQIYFQISAILVMKTHIVMKNSASLQ